MTSLWLTFEEPEGEGLEVLEIGPRNKPQAKFMWPKAHISILDIDENQKPDILADASKMPEELTGKYDAIFASHVLEHFPYWETVEVLREWGRCLKEGGRLIVFVPSLEWAAGQILSGKDINVILAHLYAGQINPYDVHKAGFTLKSLRNCLYRAGFDVAIAGTADYLIKAGGKVHRAKQLCVKSVWKSDNLERTGSKGDKV